MLIVNSFIGYILFHKVEIIMHSVVAHEFIHHVNVACGRLVGEGYRRKEYYAVLLPRTRGDREMKQMVRIWTDGGAVGLAAAWN